MKNSITPSLSDHKRFKYSAITKRKHYVWPQNNARLAVYIGFNIEHFGFDETLGARLGPVSPQPDVLNYSWREYGNRVGAWRCLEMFENLKMPVGCLINTALYDHCPELLAAFNRPENEMIAHGYSNSFRQSDLCEEEEMALLISCRERIEKESGFAPQGWLSPWISESHATPDLLYESGYNYSLNWAHDDQPNLMQTRNGEIWSIPYPQELNDIPMIISRQMDGKDFAQMIIDNFDEMLEQSLKQPLVMGIALHPYIIGQPYRLRHIRRALEHICNSAAKGGVWLTTPGQICDFMAGNK